MITVITFRNWFRKRICLLSEYQFELCVSSCLLLIGVGLRLAPHPPNFAPVTAIALFGGAVLPRRVAVSLPLLLMMISDSIIGFHNLIPFTWGCYALTALASSQFLRQSRKLKIVGLTVASSSFFFIVTNFAVWLTSGMYTHTSVGLVRCYYMALPFFRNSLLSDLLYTTALFGVYWLACGYHTRTLAGRLTVNT